MIYVEVSANSNFEAGRMIGEKTAEFQREYSENQWPVGHSEEELFLKAAPYLKAAEKAFPNLVLEMRGLAEGSGVSFERLWALNCMEEILQKPHEMCTSFFVRNGEGYIVGHSEDWNQQAKKYLYVQKRTIGDVTVFELNYATCLGGVSISVNSYGLVQAINSLYHTDYREGVPKKIVSRALSEAVSIESIKNGFGKITRASGFCHNFVKGGELLNLESSALEFDMFEAEGNYFHTNHFTRNLLKFESDRLLGFSPTTHARYELASRLISKITSVSDMQETLSYAESVAAICGEGTIGSAVFDLNKKQSYIATDRPEKETRWAEYDISFF